MPNLIRWTQTILEGSGNVLFFKLFKEMKMNQKFAKRAMIAASLTAGIVGFNSMFSDAQGTPTSSGPGSSNGNACRCHTSSYSCLEGNAISFRPVCNCYYRDMGVCRN